MEPPRAASATAETSHASGDALQAGLSAVLFGALGAYIGNRLGAKGGEHGPRTFSKKLMTLIGGTLCGAIALYVSWKRTAPAPEPAQDGEKLPEPKPLMDTRERLAQQGPKPLVQAALHEGVAAHEPALNQAR